MRIARALALAGVASRRKCETHIVAGEVAVNGQIVRDLGRQVEPGKDRLTFRGKPLSFQTHLYFILHKPAGYTTTVSDPHAEKTVYELLPPELAWPRVLPPAGAPAVRPRTLDVAQDPAGEAAGLVASGHSVRAAFAARRNPASSSSAGDPPSGVTRGRKPGVSVRVFPVGRLDRDSTGLLLFTNDGELAHRLTHPRYEVGKWYQVKLDRPLEPKAKAQLLKGIPLEGELARAERVETVGPQEVRLLLKEGKKREIRRMFQALGCRVTALCRVQLGPLKLGNLPLGKSRPLTPSEVEMLKRACYP